MAYLDRRLGRARLLHHRRNLCRYHRRRTLARHHWRLLRCCASIVTRPDLASRRLSPSAAVAGAICGTVDAMAATDSAPPFPAQGFTAATDGFVEAEGRFHIFRTCNTWVGRCCALRRSGGPLDADALFACACRSGARVSAERRSQNGLAALEQDKTGEHPLKSDVEGNGGTYGIRQRASSSPRRRLGLHLSRLSCAAAADAQIRRAADRRRCGLLQHAAQDDRGQCAAPMARPMPR